MVSICGRDAVSVLAAAMGAWLAILPVHGQSFRVSEIRRETTGAVVVSHPSRADAYYLLHRGTALPLVNVPVAAGLGSGAAASLRDAAVNAATAFYRVMEVPRAVARDTDGDGIDDVYELERPGALDPLNATDANLDPDGNGLTFLQEYARDRASVARIVRTSPLPGEPGVAVTRETIFHFDRALGAGALLTRTNLYASFGGRTLLGRVELSSDRRKVTLFYLENLPASSRIRVTLDAAGVVDEAGQELDADGDGVAGGVALLDFDTASIAALPNTAVMGRVYASDPLIAGGVSTNWPLAGVTITVDGAEQTLRTTTDSTGFFKLSPVPAGRFFVHVDGRTAQGSAWPSGAYYPFVGKAWEARAGIETNLAGGTGEIFLPLIAANALQPVSAVETNVITFTPETLLEHPELVGVEVRVPPNALFADDGTRGGRVGIAPVAPDRLPEPLPPGLNFPLVITIQTDGPLNFDRPVPVRFPNLPDPVTGRVKLPGEKSALWSFSHDTGEWEIVGPMTVSADGRYVECDPGVGVLQPGWHGEDPASRTTGDAGLDGNYSSLPSQTRDILWNAMQAGIGLTSLAFDIIASESPIGKGFAAVNVMLDVGEFIMSPSWANAAKVAVGGASLAPGVGTTMKVISFLVDSGSAASATGNLIQSAQSSNSAFNPGGPLPSQPGLHGRALANRQSARVFPPVYRARRYYQGPQQTAAVEAMRTHFEALAAEMSARSPLYRELGETNDRMLAEIQAINANPDDPFPPARLQAFVQLSQAWRDQLEAMVRLSPLEDRYLDIIREYARFQQLFDLNSVLVGIDEAAGFGDPIEVLLSHQARNHPVTMSSHYRLTGPDGVQRGRLEPGAQLKLNLRPDTVYRLDMVDPATLAVATRLFVSSATGTEQRLRPILFRSVDQSPDTDGDGITDLVEEIVGTAPGRPDTDGDGVRDGAEVQADTNPLDNMPAVTGIVGTVPLPGVASDICVDGSRAAVALAAGGLGLVDVSRVDSPTLLGVVDTPGTAQRVACSGNHVAVADGPAGLAIVDVSDPPAAFISAQLLDIGNATAVAASDGRAYVGTEAGDVVVVHLATGTRLESVVLSEAVHDVGFLRQYVLVLTARRLHVLDQRGSEMVVVGSVPVGSFAEGITGRRRVSVSGAYALVTSYPGYSAVDLSNPGAPVLIGDAVEHGPNSFKQILPTGSGIGVAAVGVNPRNDGTHDVWLYDIRDPRSRTNFTAQFTTPGVTRALALHRGLAYVADGDAGFHAFNFLAADSGSNPPMVRLDATFPLDPPAAESGAYVALIGEAADDVLVREVEFHVDGVLVSTDGSYPFEHRFRVPERTSARTQMVVRARAIDTGGNASWTPAVTVEILPDQTPPRARPAAPAALGYVVSPVSIGVVFNEPMDPGSLTPQRFRLSYLGPDRRAGTADDVAVSGVVAYAPDTTLAELRFPVVTTAGRYQAVLAAGAGDLAGNLIAEDTVWAFEVVVGTDTDNDGLTDEFETAFGMDPANPDENRNGLPDAIEDFDRDGLSNGQEMLVGTHPRQQRTFDNVLDRDLDRDKDWLTDLRELGIGTDGRAWDTDGDGWSDEVEVSSGSDPLTPNAHLPGGRVGANAAQVLRLDGAGLTSGTADALRLGEGQVMHATIPGNILRWGGPNELGHSVLPAAPVTVEVGGPSTAATSLQRP